MLDQLYAVIQSRRDDDPATSRTARLFQKGTAKIAQKVGEEAVEAAIAALVEPRERLIAESADLLYHLLVLWAAQGVRPEEVWTELEQRAAQPATREGG